MTCVPASWKIGSPALTLSPLPDLTLPARGGTGLLQLLLAEPFVRGGGGGCHVFSVHVFCCMVRICKWHACSWFLFAWCISFSWCFCFLNFVEGLWCVSFLYTAFVACIIVLFFS